MPTPRSGAIPEDKAMRYLQLLVYEPDGLLAHLLRRGSEQADGPFAVLLGGADGPATVTVREPREMEACLRLLRRGLPSVLVLKVSQDLEREFTLLERVVRLFPDTPAVVVGDRENPALAGLAWDLGAACVLFPPLPGEQLPGVVAGLLRSALRMCLEQAEPQVESHA